MATLPAVKVQKLKDVPKGSLVTLNYPANTGPVALLGIRAAQATSQDSAVVAIEGDSDARLALLLSRSHPMPGQVPPVNPNTFVLVHEVEWSIYVSPKGWDVNFDFRSFAQSCSGMLLIGEGGSRGLAVSTGSSCCYLDLVTWDISNHNSDNYMSTRQWNIGIVEPASNRAEFLFSKPRP